jgi:predicted acylesterase/phospholipase RssA
MARKILALGGGGVRIYGAIGALIELEAQGIDLKQFDLITCTSAGTIPGILLIAGKSAQEIGQIALKMPLSKFIDKGFIGEKIFFNGLENKGLGDWIDSLNVPPSDRIFINTFDKKTNSQIVFTKEDYEKRGYGFAVRCSTRLPGAMEPLEGRYVDGGILENPLMMFLNPDDQILCIHLGYAGEVSDQTSRKSTSLARRIDDLVYAFDYKNYAQFKFMVDKFNNLDIIRPKIFDIRSSNFWITEEQKKDMIRRGRENSRDQISLILDKWASKK